MLPRNGGGVEGGRAGHMAGRVVGAGGGGVGGHTWAYSIREGVGG